MKYERPSVKFVETLPSHSIADICWAYGANGKKFYYNSPGTGYVELKLNVKGSCDIVTPNDVTIVYLNGAQPSAELIADLAAAMATAGGNSAEPFKGSPFEKSPSSSWS